ncbi:hypothetical protein ES332_D13G280700v1 [Gossypium tomentosum]|uniref:Uncharacterized protein n=1 Tax=Gossypium tomentosum TaxID=34277 RepID=A0A5D2I453_GOSTO|nr:hypothetical protein ES332_D13G280700v1 [Gossypium tomentosum]
MTQQNLPPKRGQIKINIIKGFFKYSMKILSMDSRLKKTRRENGGGLSSSSTTPQLESSEKYKSDRSFDSLS